MLTSSYPPFKCSDLDFDVSTWSTKKPDNSFAEKQLSVVFVLIIICSAFVCQDFRTHINVRYLFQLFDCQLFCIFCCILMKVRRPISGLRNIRFWLFCNSTEKTKYLSTFIWKPRNLVSGSFHACCLQKLQKATSTINHDWTNGW